MASGLFQSNFLSKPPPGGSTYRHHTRKRSGSYNSRPQSSRHTSDDPVTPAAAETADPVDHADDDLTDINHDIDHIKELLTLVGPQSSPSGFAQHAFPRMFRAHISQRRIFEELEILRHAVLRQKELGSRPGTPGSSVIGFNAGQQGDIGSLDDIPEAELAGAEKDHEVRVLRERNEDIEREHESAREALKESRDQIKRLEGLLQQQKASLEEQEQRTAEYADTLATRDKHAQETAATYDARLRDLQAEHSRAIHLSNVESERVRADMIIERNTSQQAHDETLKAWEAQMLSELKQLRGNHEHRVAELAEEHESRRSEREKTLRQEHQTTLHELTTQHEQSVVERDSVLASAREKHEKHIESLSALREEQLGKLKHSHASELGKLREQSDAQLAEQDREHQALLTELEDTKSYYKKRLADTQDEHEATTRQIKQTHEDEIMKAKATHDSEMQESEKRHESQLSGLRTTHEVKLSSHQQQSKAAKEQILADRNEELTRAKSEHDQLAKKLKGIVQAKNSELQSNKATHTRELDDVHASHASAFETLRNEHGSELEKLDALKRDEADKVRKEHDRKAKHLQEDIRAKDAELQSMKDNHARELSDAHAGHASALETTRQVHGHELKRLDATRKEELDKLRKEHQADLEKSSQNAADGIAKIHESHDHELSNVKEQHQRHIKDLTVQHEAKLDEVHSVSRAAKVDAEDRQKLRLDEQSKQHEVEMKSAATAHEETQEAYKREMEELQDRHAKAVEDQRLQHEVAMKSASTAHEETQASYKQQIEELKKRYEQEADDKDNEHDRRIRDMQDTSKTTVDRLKQQHARKIDELQQEHAAEMKAAEGAAQREAQEQTSNHIHKLEAVEQSRRSAVEKLRQDHALEIEKQLEEAGKRHQAEIKTHQEQARHKRGELQERLDAVYKNSQSEVTALQEHFQKTLDQTKKEHESALQDAKATNQAQLEKMEGEHANEQKQHESQMAWHESTLANVRKEQDDLRCAHSEELEKAKEESQAQFQAFQADHDERYAEVQTSHEAKVKETSAAIENLTRQLNEKEKRATAAQTSFDEQRAKLLADLEEHKTRSRRDYETAARRHDEELQGLREEHDKHVAAAKVAAKTRMADLRKSHYQTLTAMQENEHDNASQVAELDKRLALQSDEHTRKLAETVEHVKREAEQVHNEHLARVGEEHQHQLARKEQEVTNALEQKFMSQLTSVRNSLDSTLAEKEAKGREAGSSEVRAKLQSEIEALRHDYEDALQQRDGHINDLQEQLEQSQSGSGRDEWRRDVSRGGAAISAADARENTVAAKDEGTLNVSDETSNELAPLKQRLEIVDKTRQHAEKERDDLLAPFSPLPPPNDIRRARSEHIPREVLDGNSVTEGIKAQLDHTLRQNEELRAWINQYRSSEREEPDRSSYPNSPQTVERPLARTRRSNMTSPPILETQESHENNSSPSSPTSWPQRRDLLAARERLVSDYKTKLHRVLREKASLETNFTAKYMQELASAKAELVGQHRASLQGQLNDPSGDDGDVSGSAGRRREARLSQQHLEDLDQIESKLTTEHEQRAAHREKLSSGAEVGDESALAGEEDEPFQDLVAEYDARIIALLSTDAEGARLADDLSIRPDRFEAMAQDYGRRSLEMQRPGQNRAPVQRRQLSYDARTTLVRPSWSDSRDSAWDSQRASRPPSSVIGKTSLEQERAGKESLETKISQSGSGSGTASTRGRPQRKLQKASPSIRTPQRAQQNTEAAPASSAPPSSPPNGSTSDDYWVRRKGQSISYPSSPPAQTPKTTVSTRDSPLYRTRNSSPERVAKQHHRPSKTEDQTAPNGLNTNGTPVRSFSPPPTLTKDDKKGGMRDSKWNNTSIDTRLEQAKTGVEDVAPETYLAKQRDKHQHRRRRESENTTRPKTAPVPSVEPTKDMRQENANGKMEGAKEEKKYKGFSIRDRMRSLAERQSRARYAAANGGSSR